MFSAVFQPPGNGNPFGIPAFVEKSLHLTVVVEYSDKFGTVFFVVASDFVHTVTLYDTHVPCKYMNITILSNPLIE